MAQAAIPTSEPERSDWLRAELLRPEAWPGAVADVECRRTLVSLLFFAGERVYKLKQAVDLGYIDTRDARERERLCHEEVRLNAALAPGVHLGVVPVTLRPDGHLRMGGEGQAVEWAVEMRRLPAERMLARLLERGEVGPDDMDAVAELLARFHRAAATGPGVDEFGTPEGVADCVAENLEQLQPFVAREGGVLSPPQHDFLRARAAAFLDGQRGLLLRRVAEGRIREGHGDLHAENVCRGPQGWLAFDRLEFSPRLRCLDVANDLAFLAMDLDERGHPEFAERLEQGYVERTGDAELPLLLRFYKGYRALVRAKVAALSTRQSEHTAVARERLLRSAQSHAELALGYELPATLILMCGLPGTGKSYLAPFLARPLRAQLLRSDERRKHLAGLDPSTPAGAAWGQGLYTPEARARTYASLLEDAERALAGGRSVVVDATFALRELRAPYLAAAGRRGARMLVVEVDARQEVVRERLAARAGRDASDADFAIYLRARETREPPREDEGASVLCLDTSRGAPEEAAARVFDRLVALAGR